MAISDLMNTTVEISNRGISGKVSGVVTEVWQTLPPIPAKYVPLNGDAVLQYQRMGFDATDHFLFNEDPQVLPNKSRIRFNNSNFEVRKVDHYEQGSIEYWSVVAEFTKK